MGTEEPEQRPTIAGRALRALRTGRAPVEPEIAAEDEAEVAAEAALIEPDVDVAPVDLTKRGRDRGEPEPEQTPTPAAAPAPRRRNGLLIACAVLAVAALAFAVVGLAVYVRGTNNTSAKAAQARDDALVAARIDIATLNTLDYRNAQAGLQKWLAVSTGTFHDQIKSRVSSVASAIAQAKVTTTARVIAAAVTDLNPAENSALVIASLDTTKTPAGGHSALDRNRYRATMQLVDGVWKIADLSTVDVSLS